MGADIDAHMEIYIETGANMAYEDQYLSFSPIPHPDPGALSKRLSTGQLCNPEKSGILLTNAPKYAIIPFPSSFSSLFVFLSPLLFSLSTIRYHSSYQGSQDHRLVPHF